MTTSAPRPDNEWLWPDTAPRTFSEATPLRAVGTELRPVIDEARQDARRAGSRSLVGAWVGSDEGGGLLLAVSFNRRTPREARPQALATVARSVRRMEPDVPVLVVDLDDLDETAFIHAIIRRDGESQPGRTPDPAGPKDLYFAVLLVVGVVLMLTPLPVVGVLVIACAVIGSLVTGGRRGLPVFGLGRKGSDEPQSLWVFAVFVAVLIVLGLLRYLIFRSVL